MSDARFAVVALAALSLGRPPAAAAQSVPELEHRVERLRAVWQAESAIRDSLLATRREAPRDTIRVGSLTLIGAGETLAWLRPAVLLGWDRATAELGADTALLERTIIRISTFEQWRPSGTVQGFRRLLRPFSMSSEAVGDSVHFGTIVNLTTAAGLGLGQTRLPAGADVRMLASAFRNGVWAAVASLVDSSMVAWGGAVLPSIPPEIRRTVYRELVTTRYSNARGCVDGDLHACRAALGLIISAAPLRDWYSPDDLRARVAKDGRPNRDYYPDRSAWYDGCVQNSIVEDCVRFLQGPSLGDRTPAPLGPAPRQLALAVALDLGGEGAITRLVDSHGTVPERLAAAAGAPVDSVVSAWRAAAYSGAGKPTAIDPATGGAALAWFGVFLFAALGGRRWR